MLSRLYASYTFLNLIRSEAILVRAFYSGIGLLLISAAILKFFSSYQQLGQNTSQANESYGFIHFAVLSIELAVGLSNLFRSPDKWTWRINVVLFLVFLSAVASRAYFGMEGCGCMGSLPISVFRMILFDASVLTTLAIIGTRNNAKSVDQLSLLCPIVLFLAVFAFAPALIETGRDLASPVTAKIIEPLMIELDPVSGSRHVIELEVKNRTNQTFLLGRCSTDWCPVTCLIREGIVNLHPNETRKIKLELTCKYNAEASDEKNWNAMINAIETGDPLAKVPKSLKVCLGLLPDAAELCVNIPCRPVASYSRIWGKDLGSSAE